MPRGEKSKYTDKQKRQAGHIEEGYEAAWCPTRGSRAARLGHRKQNDRRRQERVDQGEGVQLTRRPQRQGVRRGGGLGRTFVCRTLRFREEGGADP